MKKIAVINQKGGVGKSTIAVNLAYGLLQMGSSYAGSVAEVQVMLCDLDPQAHACEIYRGDKNIDYTIKDAFADPKFNINLAVYNAVVREISIESLRIVHSNILLSKTAEQISSRIHREKILHNHFSIFRYETDYLIYDCPPNLGIITINAIYAADIILIPVSYDKGALDGMADLLDTINEVSEHVTKYIYVLQNGFDVRNKQTNAYIDNELKVVEKNGHRLLKTKIRRTESLNKSRIAGEPIFVYEPSSNATQDYKDFIKEFLKYV